MKLKHQMIFVRRFEHEMDDWQFWISSRLKDTITFKKFKEKQAFFQFRKLKFSHYNVFFPRAPSLEKLLTPGIITFSFLGKATPISLFHYDTDTTAFIQTKPILLLFLLRWDFITTLFEPTPPKSYLTTVMEYFYPARPILPSLW